MKNEITAGRQFYIIPENLDGAGECSVIEVLNDCFMVQIKNKYRLTPGETAGFFSVSAGRRVYFETIVKETCENIAGLWYPVSIKHLQRREYARIPFEGSFLLQNGIQTIPAEILNISPGGLLITTANQLELLKIYTAAISINDKKIKTDFQPIRIEVSSGNFISAGKFTNISNYDKIILAQFCCGRQIELSIL